MPHGLWRIRNIVGSRVNAETFDLPKGLSLDFRNSNSRSTACLWRSVEMRYLPGPLQCVVYLAWCVSSVAHAGGPDPANTAQEIDRLLVKETAGDSQAKLAPRCNDETFLRRAFLDLVGRPP